MVEKSPDVTIIKPHCGYYHDILENNGSLFLDFQVSRVGGVVVDFGRPNDGILVEVVDGLIELTLSMEQAPPPSVSSDYMNIWGGWYNPASGPLLITVIGARQEGAYINALQFELSNFMTGGIELFLMTEGMVFNQPGDIATFTFFMSAEAWANIASSGNIVCFCIDEIDAGPLLPHIRERDWCGKVYRKSFPEGDP